MNVYLGNLKTLKALARDKESENKLSELEKELEELGYQYEDNCKANNNKENKTYHIYEIPRMIRFSRLDDEVISLLKTYSEYFMHPTQVG